MHVVGHEAYGTGGIAVNTERDLGLFTALGIGIFEINRAETNTNFPGADTTLSGTAIGFVVASSTGLLPFFT